MISRSKTLEFALQVASYEALQTGFDVPSAEHLAIGLLSLEKINSEEVQHQFQIPLTQVSEILSEWQELNSLLSMMGADAKRARRNLRARMFDQAFAFGQGLSIWSRIHRGGTNGYSEQQQKICGSAAKVAEQAGSREILAAHFLYALLRHEGAIRKCLVQEGVDISGLESALSQVQGKHPVQADSSESENVSGLQFMGDQPPRSQPKDDRVLQFEPAQPPNSRSDEDTHFDRSASAVPQAQELPLASVDTFKSQIVEAIQAATTGLKTIESERGAAVRLALLCDLPIRIEKELDLTTLLQHFVAAAVELIPSANIGAICLGKDLLLKAHLPIDEEPIVSARAARRTIDRREGFISRAQEYTTSVGEERQIIWSMYAPLLWRDEVLGVFCIHSNQTNKKFESDDLKLFLGLAQHASMAIANLRMEHDLKRNAELLERLLKNFSPKVRERLVAKAQKGKLHLGGERSEVTVLFSDIRHFTKISREMDTEEIVEMLNQCFSVCTEAILKFDGTIDKFVGDAILAVFGSPEPDPMQHENAVRAALEMQSAIANLNQQRKARSEPLCEIGIGVHCGEVLHGFIGTSERVEFTVIGEAVNRGSRYCDAAQPNQILISRELYEHVWRQIESQPTTINTKHEGTLTAYAVRRFKSQVFRKGA